MNVISKIGLMALSLSVHTGISAEAQRQQPIDHLGIFHSYILHEEMTHEDRGFDLDSDALEKRIQINTEKARQSLEEANAKVIQLNRSCFDDLKCVVVQAAQNIAEKGYSESELREAVDRLKPTMTSLQIILYQAVSRPNKKTVEEIEYLIRSDQLLRNSYGAISRQISGVDLDIFQEGARILLIEHDIHSSNVLSSISENDIRASLADPDAAKGLIVIALHADRSPALQVKMLDLFGKEIEDHPGIQRTYGFMVDRVNLALGGEQIYGTQIHCVNGKNVPKDLFQPEAVDERRESIGLNSLAEYRQLFSETC